MTENIHARNYYNALQILPEKFLFWEFMVGWLIVKTWLSVDADAASVFMCGESNQLMNNPEWDILRHSIETLARCCNFYSNYHAGVSNGSACLFEHFTTQWFLYVTGGLPFDNCTLCVRSAFMSRVFFSWQRRITSLYSHKWMDFITKTECVSCTAWNRLR